MKHTVQTREQYTIYPAGKPEQSVIASATDIHRYIQAATAPNTRKAYQSDIHHFLTTGFVLPATTEQLLAYLTHCAKTLNPHTLSRRLTALKHWHTYQGFDDPTEHPAIKKTLRGIHNTHGKPHESAKALLFDDLITICQYLAQQPTHRAARDNALLCLAFFGALRRSEVVRLQKNDLERTPDGIRIHIVKSKTDQQGQGQTCTIPYSNNPFCPVTYVLDWMQSHDHETLFMRISKSDVILPQPLSPQSVSLILKQAAKQAGLNDWSSYSSHSLRGGFATSASRQGADFHSIKAQGRWKANSTVLDYIQRGNQFHDSAVHALFLNTKKADR